MKRYALYIVSADNGNFDKSNCTYNDVVNNYFELLESDTKGDLLNYIIENLNAGYYSDENWYFITDEIEEKIIMQ
jgi:hypothetical protein